MTNARHEAPKLLLGYLPGTVELAWRGHRSEAPPTLDLSFYLAQAQKAERAKLHTIFFADTVATTPGTVSPHLEPVTLLAAIAARTEHVGLIASVSTTFTEPFNLARQIASLDHISGGRAGWNLVTSSAGGENFGVEIPPHGERYAIADEYARIVTSLWEGWDADAIIADAERGVLVDPERVRSLNWDSPRFRVRGPLDVPRTPQGRPILAQAGSSDAGRDLGARFADVIFTTGLSTLEESQEIFRDFKRRIAAAGRNPGRVPVLPGFSPVLGSTDAEARAIARELDEAVDLDAARVGVAELLGAAFAEQPLDTPLRLDLLPDAATVQGRRSRFDAVTKVLRRGELPTLRDVLLFHAAGFGHWRPVGSVERVADLLEERFVGGAADGFMILPFVLSLPGGVDTVLDHLVPELQRRGLFHREYEDGTLRDRLGREGAAA